MMKTKEQHIFDEQVRAALSEHAAKYNAEHWEQMSAQLDALDAEESDFDASLRGRLADVSRVPQMGDWSRMSAMLDDLTDDDAQFDTSLRDRLENINRRFQPNHWDMMNERLDRELTWRGKVVRYKVVEAALMLLLLFTVANTIDFMTRTEGGQNGVLRYQNSENSAAQPASDGTNSAILPNKSAKNTPAQPSKAKMQSPQNDPAAWRLRRGLPSQSRPADAPAAKGNQPIVMEFEAGESQDLKSVTAQTTVESATANAVENALSSETSAANAVATLPNISADNATNDLAADAKKAVATENEQTENAAASQQEVLAALPLGTANLLKNNELTALPVVQKQSVEKKSGWSWSAMLSWATDWVRTPYTEDRVLKKPQQVVANAGIAGKVSYRYRDVELESGLAYNTKSYSMPISSITRGSFSTNYRTVKNVDNLRLSIVSVPLSLNTTIVKKKRWDLTARFGTAMNMFTRTRLNVQETNSNPSSNPVTSGPQPTQNTDSELNTYAAGLSQKGGKWLDNIRFMGNVGVGIEYRLTPRASVFVQPQAEFMLGKGIGVMEDRYQTLNIQAGTKVRL